MTIREYPTGEDSKGIFDQGKFHWEERVYFGTNTLVRGKLITSLFVTGEYRYLFYGTGKRFFGKI
jgi:hypothetical protein